MSFYLDLGTFLPELSIFIFQGFQKLSEGEETISAGEQKRWNRSRQKLKSVPISHGLCFPPKVYIFMYKYELTLFNFSVLRLQHLCSPVPMASSPSLSF